MDSFNIIDMKMFVDFWKFTKIWKALHTQEQRIVFVLMFRCVEQFYVPNTQKQSKTGKNPEINKQSFIIWCHNWRKYRSVWYLLSCTPGQHKTSPNLILCFIKNSSPRYLFTMTLVVETQPCDNDKITNKTKLALKSLYKL